MFNKDIDRLFQEKFKDFEEIPNKRVWQGIDKQLHAKPKSFLGFKLAGFAMLFFLTIGLWYFNSNKTALIEQQHPINKIVKITKNNKNINKKSINSKANNVVTEVISTSKNNSSSRKVINNNEEKGNIVIANSSRNNPKKNSIAKTVKQTNNSSTTNKMIVLKKSMQNKDRYSNTNIQTLTIQTSKTTTNNQGFDKIQKVTKISTFSKLKMKSF